MRTIPEWAPATLAAIESCQSTQQELKDRLDKQPDLPAGSSVLSRSQLQGVGRYARSWVFSPGSLAISTLLRPVLRREHWHWYSAIAGMAVVSALNEFGVSARLKWPNDILLAGRKAGGMIAHVYATGPRDVLVLGLGLNLTGTRSWFDQRDLPAATSLQAEGYEPIPTAEEIALLWLKWLNNLSQRLEDKGVSAVWQSWIDLLDDPGHQVRVRNADGSWLEGTVTGVDARGQLQVRTAQQEQISVAAGIVEWQDQV